MRCPRCNSYVKYGKVSCKKCGLRFRYADNAESLRKRSTAAILARVGGVMGLHWFYLGYFVRGIIQALLFVGFICSYVVPQLSNIFSTGQFRVVFDAVDVIGMILLVVNIITYVLSIIDSMRLSGGILNTDSSGLMLR